MKKILTVLLLIFFASQANEAIAAVNMLNENENILSKSSRNISVIDPTSKNVASGYYPGYRGTNQLVIYTPVFGNRTGTNEFGREAVVVDDVVVKISGADSSIPLNGYVISGHGSAKKWIYDNLNVGTKILIDASNMKITAYTTVQSYRYNAAAKIKEAKNILAAGQNDNPAYDFRKSVFYIQRAEKYLKKSRRDDVNAVEYAVKSADMAIDAIQNAIPYKNEELKGVWIRPVEMNPKEIDKTLTDIASMGIDNIFLEAYYHGQTIYPSRVMEQYGIRSQREEFQGWDPLVYWIEGAKKRKIKIHVWFEAFYAGNDNPDSFSKHILSVYPSWSNISKTNADCAKPRPHLTEHNGYFLDPSNPEVRSFLLKVLKELADNYAIDGVNFDYVRYPNIVAANMPNYEASNWGYTNYAREDFKKHYGVDPIKIKYGTSAWKLWDKYRQNQITCFIKCASEILKERNIKISAVVFPDRKKSLETKMQDWSTWSKSGYVEAFTPLILSCDDEVAKVWISDIKKGSKDETDVYAGLFVAYMDGNPVDLLRQIFIARNIGTKGIILFDYAHLGEKYVRPLKSGAFLPKK